MSSSKVRPGFLIAAGAILTIALTGTTGAQLLASHNAHVTARMTAIGEQVAVPNDLIELSHGHCPSQDELVACWTAPEQPDALVDQLRMALDRASGGSSSAQCQTLRYGLRPRSCLIRFVHGSHGVWISVDGSVADRGDQQVLSGSQVRIDAV